MKIAISIDLDNYREYGSLVGCDVGKEETPAPTLSTNSNNDSDRRCFYQDALPRFVELFDRHDVRATFFVIGRDLDDPENRARIRDLADRGHEIGNHSFTHPYNFSSLTRTEKIEQIDRCADAIERATGTRPAGFRTPSLDVDGETLDLLEERGYLYDSSIMPTPLMWAFVIYGRLFIKLGSYQLGHMAAAFAPRNPYRPGIENIYKGAGQGHRERSIVEIPFSVLPIARLPFYSTLLRRFGGGVFEAMTRMYGRSQPVLHTLFHLIELAGFDDTPLGDAYRSMPALSVPLASREDFVSRATQAMVRSGVSATLSEVAATHLQATGAQSIDVTAATAEPSRS